MSVVSCNYYIKYDWSIQTFWQGLKNRPKDPYDQYDKYNHMHFLHQSWTITPFARLKILQTMNKHSPLTLILKYPYIYNDQAWNIDLETSSSLLESQNAIFVMSFNSSISNAFLYKNFIRKLVHKIVRQQQLNNQLSSQFSCWFVQIQWKIVEGRGHTTGYVCHSAEVMHLSMLIPGGKGAGNGWGFDCEFYPHRQAFENDFFPGCGRFVMQFQYEA
jgi:hypothetical protein